MICFVYEVPRIVQSDFIAIAFILLCNTAVTVHVSRICIQKHGHDYSALLILMLDLSVMALAVHNYLF